MRFAYIIPCFFALVACASLEASDHQHLLALAVQDDQACAEKGLKYPQPEYVTCRMQLQDDRMHQDWLNLQLMRQSQIQPAAVPAPYTPREYYRPLDPDHFDCQLVTEDKRDYILCEATDEKPAKP